MIRSYGTKGTETGSVLHVKHHLPNGTVRGAVFCHGRGGTALTALDLASPMQQVATSFPLICTDLGGTATWGNAASQTKVGDAITYLQGTLGCRAGAVLGMASSMGAAALLNYARANPTKFAALALCIPLVDLVYEHDNNVQGFGAEIETALGITGTYAGNASVTPLDPMQNIAAHVSGPPIKVWYASDDTTAVTARQQAFIAAVGCQSSNMGAVGHTLDAVPGSEVLAFLAQYA